MRTLALMLLVGCGGISGESIDGDISIAYGSDSPDLAVGSVIEDADDAAQMQVQIGTDKIDCDTDLNGSFFPPKGTFVIFTVAKAAGTYEGASVEVISSSSQHISINGSSGDVVIDSVDPRVTGSITFDTTDDDVGTISVTGSFDVIRCF